MPDSKPTQAEIMAKLLAAKKGAASNTPEHHEFGDKSAAMRGAQVKMKPQKPGGNRGRG